MMGDHWVHPEGELTDVPGALINIQDLIHIWGVVAGGLYDFAVPELQIYVPEQEAVIRGGAVIGDMSVDRIPAPARYRPLRPGYSGSRAWHSRVFPEWRR